MDCITDHNNVIHEGTDVPNVFVNHYVNFLGVEEHVEVLNDDGLFVKRLS